MDELWNDLNRLSKGSPRGYAGDQGCLPLNRSVGLEMDLGNRRRDNPDLVQSPSWCSTDLVPTCAVPPLWKHCSPPL